MDVCTIYRSLKIIDMPIFANVIPNFYPVFDVILVSIIKSRFRVMFFIIYDFFYIVQFTIYQYCCGNLYTYLKIRNETHLTHAPYENIEKTQVGESK